MTWQLHGRSFYVSMERPKKLYFPKRQPANQSVDFCRPHAVISVQLVMNLVWFVGKSAQQNLIKYILIGPELEMCLYLMFTIRPIKHN